VHGSPVLMRTRLLGPAQKARNDYVTIGDLKALRDEITRFLEHWK
jgi:hypothetical protein